MGSLQNHHCIFGFILSPFDRNQYRIGGSMLDTGKSIMERAGVE